MYNEHVVAEWCPDPAVPQVPPMVVDAVVAVPMDTQPGDVVAEGPADATAMGAIDRDDRDVQACQDSRYVSAFSEEDIAGGAASASVMQVSALMQQLEDLSATAQRSVAAEAEHAVEGGAALLDTAGRARVLAL